MMKAASGGSRGAYGPCQELLTQISNKQAIITCPPVRDRIFTLLCAGGAAPDLSRNLCFL